MKLIRSVINLLFYGNFWIAACALTMTMQTHYLLTGAAVLDIYAVFVGSSTLMLYALHRIIGLDKVREFTNRGRYFVIEKYKKHILFYALVSGLGATICFFLLDFEMQILLVLPSLLSLGYVIPFLKGKKRLRDLNHIKIYLIALVWAWITVILPIYQLENVFDQPLRNTLMFIERALFIFVITLPFDIRDLQIDQHTKVQTIPSKIGIPKTKRVSFIILMLIMVCISISYKNGFYDLPTYLALGISVGTATLLVNVCDRQEHDYFFTGLVDGTMLFQFVLIIALG